MKLAEVVILLCAFSVGESSSAPDEYSRAEVEKEVQHAIDNVHNVTEQYLEDVQQMHEEYKRSVFNNTDALRDDVNSAVVMASQNASAVVMKCVDKHAIKITVLLNETAAAALRCAASKVEAIVAEIRALVAAAERAQAWINSGFRDVSAGLAFITGSSSAISRLSIKISTFRTDLQACAAAALTGAAVSVSKSIVKIALCTVTGGLL